MWCWNKQQRQTREKPQQESLKLTPWENRDEQYEVVKWNAEEKWWKNRGGHSEACFSSGGRVLTIGC